MQHIKNDHENYLLYEFRDVNALQGTVMDIDPPLPECLLDRPDWQIEVAGYRIGCQGWKTTYEMTPEGLIFKLSVKFTGKEIQRYDRPIRVAIKVRKPQSPGQYYAIKPGPTRDCVIKGVLRQEERPDEMECPECEAELFPVPDKCPQCGTDLNPTMPSLGELVDKYGRDAKLDIHTGYADADLDVRYTLDKADAEHANKEKRKAHDEKVALYKEQIKAWGVMLEPEKKQQKKDQEARERAELEKLKSKYPDAS